MRLRSAHACGIGASSRLSIPPMTIARPASCALERDLFRVEPADRHADSSGLAVLGAPKGEGMAAIVAREVRDRLATGCDPEDVLVLFPRWDEQADLTLEALRSWGLPASGGPPRPLATEPAVAALLTALSLPVAKWEASRVIHLLRHGHFRPDWPEARSPLALAAVAAAVRETRIFRDRDTIRQALKGAGNVGPDEKDRRKLRQGERARLALALFDRLASALDGLDLPATWRHQAAKSRALAAILGLDSGDGSPALARLFAALDDHAATLEALGHGGEAVYWPDFVRELGAIVREVPDEPEPPAPGTVRLATVSGAEGAAARHVLLAGLEEGTFPAREAIDLDPATPTDEDAETEGVRPADVAFARELRRFLGVAAMARQTLVLLSPTNDEKGQELLQAGFLDDVESLFTRPAWESCRIALKRLDPILPAELAIPPAEVCVRAVGRACLDANAETLAELADLASRPEHRDALAGAAIALRLNHRRLRRSRFGPYEGDLADPAAVRRISESYGPTRPVFSASQLETLAACPFKYFLHHVLKLEPIDDREEFDEDASRRGQLVHEALETLHQVLKSEIEDVSPLPERVKGRITPIIDAILDRQLDPASDVDRGLRAIDAERLRRTGQRYARQFEAYHAAAVAVECHDFEVQFGKEGAPYPGLVLGDEAAGLGLQGMIDRIDLIRVEGRVFFRIIDYKTGSCPTKRQVADGLALQLPLYALATQRLILADRNAEPLDAAYWGLRHGGGFKPALQVARLDTKGLKAVTDWERYLRRLEAFVLALVDRLRHADFPVRPRESDCTRSCDFRTVCRIGQVRHARKSWPEAPVMPEEEQG